MIFNIKFSIIITSKFLLYFYICLDKQKQITMSINKVTIVGIKGFKGSGKDTVASMISYILHDGIMQANYDTWLLYHKNDFIENDEIIIYFADKLKDDISEFCGIDRKLLDRQDIKEVINLLDVRLRNKFVISKNDFNVNVKFVEERNDFCIIYHIDIE